MCRRTVTRMFVAAVLAMAADEFSVAQDVSVQILSTPIDISALPYQPELTLSVEPELCNAFLAGIRRAYLTSSPLMNQWESGAFLYDTATGEYQPMTWVFERSDHPLPGKVVVDHLYKDYGDSKLVAVSGKNSDEEDIYLGLYYGGMLSSIARFTFVAFQTEQAWQDGIEAARNAAQYFTYPAFTYEFMLNDNISQPLVFQIGERLVWLTFDTGAFVQKSPERIKLAEFTSAGAPRDLCEARFYPASLDYSLTPSMPLLNALLDEVIAAPPSCGSMIRTDRRERIDELARLALLRPWVDLGERGLGYNREEVVDANLRARARSSPGAREQDRRLSELLASANLELTAYYVSAFSLPQEEAQTLANTMTRHLKTSGFIFSESLDDAGRGNSRWNSDPDYLPEALQQTRLAFRELLADNADLPVFASLIADTVAQVPAELLPRAFPLAETVLRPDVLALMLEAGADVNDPNVFEKTPLMSAAHQNSLESARLLVEAGADVNRRTVAFTSCDIRVTVSNRSALMYAVENASPDLIRYLLEQGGDVRARDSREAGVRSYLENSTLPDAEKERVRVILAEFNGD